MIHEIKIVFKTRENGELKYYERVTKGNKTIWYMDSVNYKLVNGVWSVLTDGVFVVCDEPKIELKYKKELKK